MSAPDFSQKLALYGGSFDPIHNGHLHVANCVLQSRLGIKNVCFVPAWHSPGKATPTGSAELRWELVLAALLGQKNMSAWDWEIQQKTESFTIETLQAAHALGAQKERLFWILGADSYQSFSRWKNPLGIRALCQLVVVDRTGHPINLENPDDLLVAIPEHPASSSVLRQQGVSRDSARKWLPEAVLTRLEKLSLSSQNPYDKN